MCDWWTWTGSGRVTEGRTGARRPPPGPLARGRSAPVFGPLPRRGKLSGSIGVGYGRYGRLLKLLGRAPMLRASRREDRKRVPQYSSPYLPWWAALGRTYGNLPGSVSAAPARHPVGDFSHANPWLR